MVGRKIGKRPAPKRSQAPPTDSDLEAASRRVRYLGSPKHKFGATRWLGVGRPGANPNTVEQARKDPPKVPYTMICPIKWNRRDPSVEATKLLNQALLRGQVEPFPPGGLPKFVYARDPEDRSIIYRAHLMPGADGAYKAYPLTDAEIDDLEIQVL